jgi:hypothetical protein
MNEDTIQRSDWQPAKMNPILQRLRDTDQYNSTGWSL